MDYHAEIIFLLTIISLTAFGLLTLAIFAINSIKAVTINSNVNFQNLVQHNIRLTEMILLLKEKINLLNSDIKNLENENSSLRVEIQALTLEVSKLQDSVDQ